ncbi:MAG: tRNA 2-thiouridine(34) synthase MnmA [Ruminococcaceae bacterium]|nr:tRNA 2-thiouridine(34) synthase MnmA [Oscillospiraceae bacterium]
MKKILTAMSGGVDSAVCCDLLRRQGYEVGGATMLLRCGAEGEAEDARMAAAQMGVPFHLFCWQKEFHDRVESDFCRAYASGKTPNPCIVCNKTMKFGLFLDEALRLGYDGMATGHYARIEHDKGADRWLIRMAEDRSKDQTYMLYSLSQFQLSHTILPLGGMTKAEARELAKELNLSLAHKHDSQDICFVPDGDYCAYLQRSGLTLTPGRYRDLEGNDLGPHRGAESYTIGQRRGLHLSCGERVYVVQKNGTDVIIGPNGALFSKRVQVGDVNYIAIQNLTAPRRVRAKVRYTPRFADATLIPTEYGAELLFDEPQRAVTPGQAAVFYVDDYVLGGGTILGAGKE